MVSLGFLTAESIGYGHTFNWIWLVELLVCSILVLWFLFYFNRLFATLISYGIRAYTWHKFRVYVDIQALQISFLAGRIFFKGVRYHGQNETIFVQNGYVTWMYWLRSVRQIDLARYEESVNSESRSRVQEKEDESKETHSVAADKESGPVKKVDTAQARIAVIVSGLEWFVYNRSPVYDSIIAESLPMRRDNSNGQDPCVSGSNGHTDSGQAEGLLQYRSKGGQNEAKQSSSGEYSALSDSDPRSLKRENTRSTVAFDQDEASLNWNPSQSLITRFLPIMIECQKGAISLGNETTRALLVTTFDKATGHIDASSSGPLDVFRQLFDFDIEHPVVHMRPNPDFRQSQQAEAERVLSDPKYVPPRRRWWSVNFHFHRRKRKLWNGLRNLVPLFRSSVDSFHASSQGEKRADHNGIWQAMEPDTGQWLGLSRYLDDDERDDHEGWAHVDYARFSTILDCPSIHMSFYWDVPGKVSEPDENLAHPIKQSRDINRSDPPAYGIDLSVRGGTLNYGPWADRLRAEIQNAFLPNPYRSSKPASDLSVGSYRQSTIMIIRVEVQDEIILRVPTKENSKDWQWRGRSNTLRRVPTGKKPRLKKHFRFRRGEKSSLGPDVRPFGWLSFSVAADSTVRYEMDMIARRHGYHNHLELDLKDTRAISSANHGLLWRCQSQRVVCDLSNPLGWNDLHTWVFEIHNESMQLFLLRDHMFLLIDLIDDFTAGPKPEYMTFVPFHYHIGLKFANLKLYLNANDSNIIDNPSDLEDNTFLILGMQVLNGSVDIPIQHFSPSRNSVLFKGNGNNVSLDLTTPLWNTLHTFVCDDSIAMLKDLNLDGSYNYCADVSPQLTDSLVLDISGTSPRVFLHGFLIRYFMNVKENYFGEDLHFKTLEEYQDGLSVDPNHETIQNGAPAKKENDLDVILTVRAHRSCALMPGNLYSRKNNMRFDILLVEADMRFTNYYMDLDVRSSPIEVSLESLSSEAVGVSTSASNCQLFIDGAVVSGHRLFGAPPTEPTYVCNWDFGVGKITGQCSTAFLQTFMFAIRSFTLTLDDDENALPISHGTVIHDVTFLKAHVDAIRVWIVAEDTAFLVSAASADVSFDDWARSSFSRQVQASIPQILIAAVDGKSAIRHHIDDEDMQIPTLACFQTTLETKVADKKANFARERALQQHHIRFHDRRTHRVDWVLNNPTHDSTSIKQTGWAARPVAMPVPIPSQPVNRTSTETLQFNNNTRTPSHGRQIRQKSSFLSLSSVGSRHAKEKQTGSVQKSTRSNIHHPDFQKSYHRYPPSVVDQSATTTLLTVSSPWTSPYFSLQNVTPDLRDVPAMPSFEDAALYNNRDNIDSERSNPTPSEMLGTAHTGIFCELKNGFRGFCTPEFFNAVSSLVRDLEPKHPIDQLDAVHVETISEIMAAVSRALKPGQVTDLSIHLPFTNIKMISTITDQQGSQRQDQYDVLATQSHATLRISTIGANGDNGEVAAFRGPLVHVLARDIKLSVSEKSAHGLKDRASAQVTLSDLGFWLGSRDKIRMRLQLQSIELATWGTRIEYLASLIQRTGAMTEKLVQNFQGLGQKQLTRHLVYHLTQQGPNLTDPLFLTRPSYVLRSAGNHLRLNDSWKIMSRLRQLYVSLPTSTQENIVEECFGHHFELPEDAERHVLSSFDQWRNWDHDRLESTPIMNVIFGTAAASSEPFVAAKPIEADLYVGGTAILLDPGPKQSALLLGDMNAGISSITSYATIATAAAAAADQRDAIWKIQVQSYISRIALNVDWEIVELVGDTLEQFKLFELGASQKVKHFKAIPVSVAPRLDLSVVLGTDRASITVDTMNLNLRLTAEKLQTSLAHLDLHDRPPNSYLMVASTTASAKLKHKSKTLLGWRLVQPNVYLSYISRVTNESPDDLRLAATCQILRFDLKEDVLGMLELAYLVVDNEVSSVQSLISRVEKLNRDKSQGQLVAETKSTNIHIAMFLEDYRLKFTILPSFNYIIAGEVARTSIIPRKKSSLVVDFDLKDNRHFFRSGDGHAGQITPALEIPPINGRVTTSFLKEVTALYVQTTFEKITFEAAAVRACIDAINRPDLARVVGNVKESVQRINTRVTDIFPPQKPEAKVPVKLKSSSTLQYTSHTTLAGFNVHCGAPSVKGDDFHAEVDLMLGFTTLSLHNRTIEVGIVHEQPQFEINVRELALGIRRNSRFEDTNFGRLGFNIKANGATELDKHGNKVRVYRATSEGLNVDLYAETASLVVDVAAFLQARIKSFTLNEEARNFRPLRRLTIAGLDRIPDINSTHDPEDDAVSNSMFDAIFSLDLNAIQIRWLLYDEPAASHNRELEDLIFSIQTIDLKTKREGSARLMISNLQLQMVPKSLSPLARSSNSALLPEVVFNAAYLSSKRDRRFAFQAAGKALDLRLASDFIVPASMLQNSLGLASAELRNAKESWASSPASSRKATPNLLGSKRLGSLLVDADFAGAIVTIKPREEETRSSVFGILKGNKRSRAGRYGQAMHGEAATEATMRAPGIAMKVQYKDDGHDDPTLSAEFRVAASSNVLYPSVVPLILEISSSIKEIIRESKPTETLQVQSQTQSYLSDTALGNGDPVAILGRCKLNAGLWIQSQEFSLSCQPIARVAATARFDDIFMTINTVQSPDQDRFFALVTTFNKLHASVQHVYSRDSTASFDVDSIVVSMMNSKHISSRPGISAIVNISPMKTDVNAKQLQDFLLFREIWYPPELRQTSTTPAPAPTSNDAHVQRYQQVAATGSFLWNAVVSVEELKVQVDLGQSLGKSAFTIAKLWASSKKSSDYEQNLCVGFEKVGVDSTGRMSGFVELQNFNLRTSIRWPQEEKATKRAPLVQGSVGFAHLRVKAAFDYQPFAVADISSFEFLIYNVRQPNEDRDRLVGILNGGKVQVFCTTASAAQGLALYQAFERLIQEKQDAYHSSLRELDKYLRRKSVFPSGSWTAATTDAEEDDERSSKVPFSLHTDVVVTLREVSVGVFPTTFFDNQIFKAEATDAQARFAVATRNEETHSGLGMTLGQLRIALANVGRGTTQALGEVSVPDVIQRATGSRGGTILKVPKVIAAMSTWQLTGSNTIEYTFKSIFEGKVDVGWNYSRISFIRGMWNAHSKAFAQRLGKPLPQSAVKITAETKAETGSGQEKITAVVNVPQSKFDYVAREPPIIDTPQLQDLGEATPRLEWLGLHRERLPGVTHQFIIVTLLEIAKEVEDAYSRILGSA